MNHKSSDKDIERGFGLLEIACGQDDIPACATLGLLYVDRRHDKARDRARELLTRACDRGSGEGCTGLGEILRIDRRDSPDAVTAWQKACALGDARGCELLARDRASDIFGDGGGLAEQAFTRACALGKLSSCHSLALLEAREPTRRAASLELLRQTCARGHAESCATAAFAFAPVLSRHPDCGAARPLAVRACKSENADGCAVADACELVGAARPAALDSLQRACARGAGLACLYWADAQAPGVDVERVEKAYQRSCDSGSVATQVACPRLAGIALGRAKLSIDAEQPLAVLRAACEGESSGEACCVLADEHERGRWMTEDATKASELRSKACDLGEQRCCRTLVAPPAPRE